MKILSLISIALSLYAGAIETETVSDSLSVSLDEVVIETNTVSRNVPMAMTTLDSRRLKSADDGRDLPWLLQLTPSLVATSDNGLGIGLSGFRIRGTDASRINLTFDGAALNDPEDQTVFWANMNAFSSSAESVQIQRGVGTSTNGSGAFGATITMQSERPSEEPYTELTGRLGSYGIRQFTVKAGSGLLNDHWSLDGRWSGTHTDGYIDRTAGVLGSYFSSVSYLDDDIIVQLKNFGSYEHTQQAWNGVPSDSIAAGNRTWNSLGVYTDSHGQTAFYPTTDNYIQNNTHLSLLHTTSGGIVLHGLLHYTYGQGYYDDYKTGAKYYQYGLESYTGEGGLLVNSGDLIRQKWLRNHSAGLIVDARYHTERADIRAGVTGDLFKGLHWGEVSYARGYPHHILGHYYDSDAIKEDVSAYLKGEYKFFRHLYAYGDLQYRFVHYTIGGSNDKYLADHSQQQLNINQTFPFFNPKAGISWRGEHHTLYSSVAHTHREPTRNNYTDAGTDAPLPRSETLDDLEAGYTFSQTFGTGRHAVSINAGANLYSMNYHDQLIQTGRLSDIGEALTENVAKSWRRGIEFTAGAESGLVALNGTCTLSRNRIEDFTEYIDNWDGSPVAVHYDQTDIAFSPAVTAAGNLRVGDDHWWGALVTRYVGRQYLDNTSCLERSLDPYCVSDLQFGYAFTARTWYSQTADFRLSLDINNLFGACYATGGWVYTAISISNGYTPDHRYHEDGLFVQSPRTTFLTLNVKI